MKYSSYSVVMLINVPTIEIDSLIRAVFVHTYNKIGNILFADVGNF